MIELRIYLYAFVQMYILSTLNLKSFSIKRQAAHDFYPSIQQGGGQLERVYTMEVELAIRLVAAYQIFSGVRGRITNTSSPSIDAGDLGTGDSTQKEIYRCKEVIFRTNDHAPPCPDKACGHQGELLSSANFVNRTLEILKTCGHQRPFHDWGPEMHCLRACLRGHESGEGRS